MARREPSRVRGILGERARDALFDLAADAPRLVEVDTGSVRPNPAQPRRQVDEAGLAELAASIERHGLLQPIVVKEEGDGYVLVAGQRRLLALTDRRSNGPGRAGSGRQCGPGAALPAPVRFGRPNRTGGA